MKQWVIESNTVKVTLCNKEEWIECTINNNIVCWLQYDGINIMATKDRNLPVHVILGELVA